MCAQPKVVPFYQPLYHHELLRPLIYQLSSLVKRRHPTHVWVEILTTIFCNTICMCNVLKTIYPYTNSHADLEAVLLLAYVQSIHIHETTPQTTQTHNVVQQCMCEIICCVNNNIGVFFLVLVHLVRFHRTVTATTTAFNCQHKVYYFLEFFILTSEISESKLNLNNCQISIFSKKSIKCIENHLEWSNSQLKMQ